MELIKIIHVLSLYKVQFQGSVGFYNWETKGVDKKEELDYDDFSFELVMGSPEFLREIKLKFVFDPDEDDRSWKKRVWAPKTFVWRAGATRLPPLGWVITSLCDALRIALIWRLKLEANDTGTSPDNKRLFTRAMNLLEIIKSSEMNRLVIHKALTALELTTLDNYLYTARQVIITMFPYKFATEDQKRNLYYEEYERDYVTWSDYNSDTPYGDGEEDEEEDDDSDEEEEEEDE